MIGKVLALLVVSAWGWSSPHREAAFLSASAPDEEEMGPNMNFTPVSTTMQCCINLALQYMTIYVALGVCRSYLDYKAIEYSKSEVQKALKYASDTVFYAPMVCLMFVAFRMRVLQLSKGTGNPQDWVRYAMQSVAYSILINTVLVLIIPAVAPKSKEGAPAQITPNETGDLPVNGPNPFGESGATAVIFHVLRYLNFLSLYAGFGCVVAGVFMYEPPAGTWEGEVPSLSPAVGCTVILSTTFFLVYFLQALSVTLRQLNVMGDNSKFENCMQRAADTFALAPMLCVLFLGARMRALQMDPVGGNPQKWAQNCFYACTYAIIFQTCLAALLPYLIKGSDVKAPTKDQLAGDQQVDLGADYKGSWVVTAFTVIRWIVMVSIYTGAVAVVCSVFTIEHPDGKEHTPPVSPTMQCVSNLAFQYFFIYFMLWILFTCKELNILKDENVDEAGNKTPTWSKAANEAIESAKSTVQFAPMLSVLFIATRMRALQITDNKGAPQGWVQDGMYLASWSIFIQCMMCLIMPFFLGKTYKVDTIDPSDEGKDTTDKNQNVGNQWGAYLVSFIRYAALLALIGGMAAVITGVFLMTPETANGRGAIPLIADGTLPVDLAPPPPSITDVPGAETAMETTGETIGAGHDLANEAETTVTSPVVSAGDAVAETVTG